MRGKNIVITGGAGFIGSHLGEELAKENKVLIIDNFSTGKRENIMDLLKKDNVQLIEGDITDLELLIKAFKGIDYVFHLAANPNVQEGIENPIQMNEVNILGTLNVLIAARDNNVNKIVYASSSAVYGDTDSLPQVETMSPMPTSPYAVTKLTGEYYCKIFYELYGLRTTSLRYFNVYGPRQDPNSQYAAVIPKFIRFVMQNQSPTIYGDGKQTRDFIFVKDVVKASILAAECEKADNAIINIGCGKSISINQLAEKIIKLSGKKLKPVYYPPLAGDIRHSLANVSRTKELLDFEAKTPLEDGLLEIIKHFKTKCVNNTQL